MRFQTRLILKNRLFIALLLLQCTAILSQNLESNRDKIKKAQSELQQPFSIYSMSFLKGDLDSMFTKLITSKEYDANNEFHNYIIGGLLYDLDADKSYEYHEKAYHARPNDENFVFEYALELHRKQKFERAIELYERYLNKNTTDKRFYALLADCYINIGKTKKAIENWNKADHPKNHTGIDFAIHIVYGRSDQMRLRNTIRKEINEGNFNRIDDLIFLDKNWEKDWYNTMTQAYLLDSDLELIKSKLGENNNEYSILKAFTSIKTESSNEDIIKILSANKLLIEDGEISKFGKNTSLMLKICLQKGILKEKDFYLKRGEEILKLAKETKNSELLNIYAYLQATVDGKVNPEIDKFGWKELKDERFAISFLTGQEAKSRCSNPELNEALKDFPNSSQVYLYSVDCAKNNGKKLKLYLIELIKKEFKTLQTDENRYSYRLKSYFAFLETEK
jgi:Anaphase-promoting complex, cyclosome, subunit 3